jgi:hypothetical protein
MNPRCTPKRILNAHVSNEPTNLQRSLWSTAARSRFPPPIGSKSGPMPTDHRLRFENSQGIQHARNKTIQPSKHQAIDALEGRSFGRFALQDVELMAQNKDLRRVPSIGRAWSARMPATRENRSSGTNITRFAVCSLAGWGFRLGQDDGRDTKGRRVPRQGARVRRARRTDARSGK